jgi:hypothetical protein
MIARRAVVLLGTAVVSMASVARIFTSIYTHNMGRWMIAKAATSGTIMLALLRGYAGADMGS